MLDIIDSMTYIIYMMTEISDKDLVKNLFDWGRYHRFSLAETSRLIGRTRAWGSLIKKMLENGDDISISQVTRDNIIELLDLK